MIATMVRRLVRQLSMVECLRCYCRLAPKRLMQNTLRLWGCTCMGGEVVSKLVQLSPQKSKQAHLHGFSIAFRFISCSHVVFTTTSCYARSLHICIWIHMHVWVCVYAKWPLIIGNTQHWQKESGLGSWHHFRLKHLFGCLWSVVKRMVLQELRPKNGESHYRSLYNFW